MNLRTCNIPEFIQRAKGKSVVCWGAGGWLEVLTNEFSLNIENTYSYVVDSNPALHGTVKNINGKKLTVQSPQYLFENLTPNTIILITMRDWEIVYETLENNVKFQDIDCYPAIVICGCQLDALAYEVPPAPNGYRMNSEPQIPKTIHYIWFGGKPVPDKFKFCMDSWAKFCPDYEIKKWDESNYDVTKHRFMRETMEAGRPGLTADYARFDIIYEYGGIYLDIDVELLKSLDELLYNCAFCGFKNYNSVALGLGFGAAKNHSVIKNLRDSYDKISAYNKDEWDRPVASPIYQTETLQKYGLVLNGHFQVIENMAIYPTQYFDAISLNTGRSFVSKETFAIHHYAASWLSDSEYTLLTQVRKRWYDVIQNECRIENFDCRGFKGALHPNAQKNSSSRY